MSRMMINATLFNVSTEDDQYAELRDQMITDLVADELDQPENVLRTLLEDYVFQMFYSMEDEELQDMYDNLKEGIIAERLLAAAVESVQKDRSVDR